MAYAIGVVVFIVGLAISIALHELGHLVPAKLFGVKVPQYMIGFGPTLWSRTRGETEYGVKAIPLGGYCKLIGMTPPLPEATTAVKPSRVGQLIGDGQADREVIAPEDADRVFYKLSVPKKVIVMVGGPVMNLLIASVLMTGVISIHGLPQDMPGAQVAAVQTGSAAATAGLQAGDIVTDVNGEPITTNTQVSAIVRPRAGQPTAVTYTRDGSSHTTSVTPTLSTVPVNGADGKQATDPDGTPATTQAGLLGIQSTPASELVRQPLSAAPGFVGSALGQTVGVVVNLPQRVVGVAQAAFSSEQRDPNGPMSIVGAGRIGGEVASATSPTGGEMVGDKAAQLALLIAAMNLALFVFNLIPLPPLDGGHVAGALWEAVKKGYARLRGLPQPAYVDVTKAMPVMLVVITLYLGMSLLLIYADIVKPVNL